MEFANASAATLAVFDSACQTLMYVLCYRMDDITRHGGEPAETFRSMPLRQILYLASSPSTPASPRWSSSFWVRAAAAGMEGFDQALIERHKREDKERKDRADGARAGGRWKFHRRGRRRASRRRGGSRAGSHNGAAGIRASHAVGGDAREGGGGGCETPPAATDVLPLDPYLPRRSSALLRLPQSGVTWRGNARDDDDDADGFSDDDDDDDDVATLDSELGSEDVGESSSDDDTDPGAPAEGTR